MQHIAKPHISLLVAEDEPGLRVLVAARAADAIEGLTVLEAEDGAEAVQLGLQERPRLALLDVQLPRLGGIEAALTLRELRPDLRVALFTARPDAHRDRAREERLPLFDTLDLDEPIRWLARQARPPIITLTCAGCGYGAARPVPPVRCPMCQRRGSWLRAGQRVRALTA
jgi:CheY-like chemotaxis protein